jgi:hypothetical protein
MGRLEIGRNVAARLDRGLDVGFGGERRCERERRE